MLLHKNCIQDTNAAYDDLQSKISSWNKSPNPATLQALQHAITHFLELLKALDRYFVHTQKHASSDDNHLHHLDAELKQHLQGTHAEGLFAHQVNYFSISLQDAIRHIKKLRSDGSLRQLLDANIKGQKPSTKGDLLALTAKDSVLALRLHQFGEEIAVLETSSNAMASYVRAHRDKLKKEISYLEDEMDLEEGFERNIRAWL